MLVSSFQADNTRTVRLTLVIVAGAVGCLLSIACMNIATEFDSGDARHSRGLSPGPAGVLYGIRPSDLVSFAAALAALLTVATGAAFAAALRATRISPVDVLRDN